MKKFVVAIDGATPTQRDAITEKLKRPQFGWWHWFSDIWLVVDGSGEYTEDSLLKELHQAAPDVVMLVLNVTGSAGYMGWGTKQMGEWLEKQWR